MNPFLLADFYKVGHVFQYPAGTEYVYSNFTPRKSRMAGVDKAVWFGLQYFIITILDDLFTSYFFDENQEIAIRQYDRRMRHSLGAPLKSYKHIRDLHNLGFLPLRIKSLPEGSLIPMRMPGCTVENTIPGFGWLVGYIETVMSCMLWQSMTSATIAHNLRVDLDKWAKKTGMSPDFVQWQGHDFSFRGMAGLDAAVMSGMGHLTSFTGTDTIPAIDELEIYYNADSATELIGGSVPATEHSVMCAYGPGNEKELFHHLITNVYPEGIVSVVSDTWNLWTVLETYLPRMKDEILKREGKLVIRPDSGDPVKILCGDPDGSTMVERMGVIESLWGTFGGTTTETGHKLLDSHIGAIYGDGISRDRMNEICRQLEAKGFASQVVFGIGSYTYQGNTRDTLGTAMKATSTTVLGEERAIFKDPVTDDGTKKSARGFLRVDKNDLDEFVLSEDVSKHDADGGLLKTVYVDGVAMAEESLSGIRKRLADERAKLV